MYGLKNKKNNAAEAKVNKLDQDLFNACYFGQESRVRQFIGIIIKLLILLTTNASF